MGSVIEELKKEAAFANRTSGTSRIPSDWIFKLIAAYEAERAMRLKWDEIHAADSDQDVLPMWRELAKLKESADRAVRELEGE